MALTTCARRQGPRARPSGASKIRSSATRPSCLRARSSTAPRFEDDPLTKVAVLDDLSTYYGDCNMWWRYPPLILAPSQAKQLYGGPFRNFWDGLPLGGSLWGGFSIIGCSLPDADPYAKQVLYQIGRAYGYGRDHPEERFGPMNRICVVNRVDGDDADRLRGRYRFLPRAHTDFLLDGLDDEALAAVFREGDA